MDEQHFPGEGYDGAAAVSPPVEVSSTGARTSTTEQAIQVEVTVRGHFEPLDGRFHWYGRIAADEALAARHANGATVVLTTPHGRAEGRLSDLDPWGRYRISGTGRPPY